MDQSSPLRRGGAVPGAMTSVNGFLNAVTPASHRARSTERLAKKGDSMYISCTADGCVVSVCSWHPLAAQTLRDAIQTPEEFTFKTRLLIESREVSSAGSGELVLLDGYCDAWPKWALRFLKAGNKVIVLLPPENAHLAMQVRALFLGISGVIVTSQHWQMEIRNAVKAVLEGRLWISGDVLNEYTTRLRRQSMKQSSDSNPLSHLTTREEQIMTLLLRGESNKEIGNTLGISERTVKYHVSNILQKSQVSNRKELCDSLTGDDKFDGTPLMAVPAAS